MRTLRGIAGFAAWSWRLWALTWVLTVALASATRPALVAAQQGTLCVLAMFVGYLYARVIGSML